MAKRARDAQAQAARRGPQAESSARHSSYEPLPARGALRGPTGGGLSREVQNS